jgi:hypothetical protein
MTDSLLNDSRITPSGNGDPTSPPSTTPPTSGQKWWAAVLLGIVFAILSSPVAYNITSGATQSVGGNRLSYGSGPTTAGLIIHTLIFILVVRVILW